MKFSFLIKEVLRTMNSHKVRTSLTVLGVVIGIASVIVVFSAGEGIYGLVVGQVEAFGTDIIETEIKIPSSKKGFEGEKQSATSLVQGVQITSLSIDDLEDIKSLSNIKDGYAGIMDQELVQKGGEVQKAFILGASGSYIDIDPSEIEYGRFFSRSEDNALAPVAVLGSKMKEKLFGESDPLGRTISIRNVKFRVIGVMEERGAVMSVDFDDFVYVPVKTLQKRIMGIDHVSYTVHQVYDSDLSFETAEQMRWILRDNHNIAPPEEARSGWTDTGKDDFRVVTTSEMLEILETITDALTLVLIATVIISLTVGGVGVMNVMYVIVNERTKEIGLRKALGARYKDIMLQFLSESVLVTLFGGILGIIIGILVSYGIALGARSYGLDWNFIVPLKAFVTALFFSVVFGIFFGVYPARRAARLDPVEALRSE